LVFFPWTVNSYSVFLVFYYVVGILTTNIRHGIARYNIGTSTGRY